MAKGVPVAVSDIPIFHEIAGRAGVYFDQDDPASIAAAISTLTDPQEWEEKASAGQEQSQRFAWSDSAEALVDLIREVHAGRA